MTERNTQTNLLVGLIYSMAVYFTLLYMRFCIIVSFTFKPLDINRSRRCIFVTNESDINFYLITQYNIIWWSLLTAVRC